MSILLKIYKPDYVEPHYSKEFTFTNTGGPHFNFVGCESLLESNSPVIVVRKTRMTQLILPIYL